MWKIRTYVDYNQYINCWFSLSLYIYTLYIYILYVRGLFITSQVGCTPQYRKDPEQLRLLSVFSILRFWNWSLTKTLW